MPIPTGQTIQLSPENVAEIARNTLKPSGWKCEWIISSSSKHSPAACSIVLGSWNAYLKHLLRHAQFQSNKTGKFVCDLPRCSLPVKGASTSFDQLKEHIENSHMSRTLLYCPFRGCEGVAFARGAFQLDNHFRETHFDLLNKVITIPSDVLLPMSVPHPPIPLDLPPLPKHPTLLLPAVRGTRIRHLEGPPLSQVSQASYASQASPRKRLRLHRLVEEETSSEASSIYFEDLEKTQIDKNGECKEPVQCVLGLVAGPRFDVARPQPILDPTQFGLKSPPVSIHYEVFSNRFDEMERAVAPKVNMPIVPISTQTSSTMH